MDRLRTLLITVNIYGKHVYTNKLQDLSTQSICGTRFGDRLQTWKKALICRHCLQKFLRNVEMSGIIVNYQLAWPKLASPAPTASPA